MNTEQPNKPNPDKPEMDLKTGNENPNAASENGANPDNPESTMEAVQGKTEEETITVPLQEFAAQMKIIDDLKDKVKEYSNGWQRERADFSNYRSRVLRDQDITRQDITSEIVKKYLAIHDDMELALKNAPKNEELASWIKGIQLIDQKLQSILESEGVQRIPAENETFNPNRHEAIAVEENPQFKSGQIIEILQQGYTIGDRVIRPARVKLAK